MYFSKQWRGNYFPVRNFSSAVFFVTYTKIHTHAFCCVNNKFLCFIHHKLYSVSEMKIRYKTSRLFRLENLFYLLRSCQRILNINRSIHVLFIWCIIIENISCVSIKLHTTVYDYDYY